MVYYRCTKNTKTIVKACTSRSTLYIYIKDRFHQLGLADFNQPIGLKMNPENRWVKKAATIPWFAIEDRYASLFPSKTGMPAKPLRTALGLLIIQKQYGYADRELLEQITENPYCQYFIGLPGYQQEPPFAPSLLVEFRKRLTADILGEINEMIIEFNHPDDQPPTDGADDPEEASSEMTAPTENKGTMMLDATCAPQQIAFPQDINLLNEARENLETIIDTVCYEYNEPNPRTYRNRENLKYCKAQGIRFSGLALGRPKKDPAENRKIIYKDAVDRIEIERSFSLAKRCYGLGLIWTKLDTTTKNSICLSIIALNVDRLTAISFCDFLNLIFQSAWRRYRGMSISTNRQLDIVTV